MTRADFPDGRTAALHHGIREWMRRNLPDMTHFTARSCFLGWRR